MLWVKSFHIIFVASWFAGLFYLPRIFVNLAMVPEGSVAERERLLLMARKLLRFTTLLAVGSMLALGGDVIRGFSFAIFAGIILGTYSSVYVAKNLVLFLGLDRTDKPRASGKGADHEFANIDA